MSRTLREFLRENAPRLKTDLQRALVRRDEWIAAVDRLRTDIWNWLHDSDPDGLFEFKEVVHTIVEEGIGAYHVNGLKVILGPRVIELVPVSRTVVEPWAPHAPTYVMGARGRVDLTNGLDTYSLYRVRPDEHHPVDAWFIFNRQTSTIDSLNQNSFETIFQDLLE